MAQDDPLNDLSARQMTAPMTMMGKESEEYFQTVVISALLNILNDSALAAQFLGVIEVIMKIFKTQGLRCAAFLPQVCDYPYGVRKLTDRIDCSSVHQRGAFIEPAASRLLPSATGTTCRNYQATHHPVC